MFYALVKNQPYFQSKINLFVAFAPVTRFQHSDNEFLANWGTGSINDGRKMLTAVGIKSIWNPIF